MPGQFNQDAIIAELIEKKILPERGFYIDVGAAHPIAQSNTDVLYQRGWRGLLIEPQKILCYELKKARPEDTIWCGVASNEKGTAILYGDWLVASLDKNWNKKNPKATVDKDTLDNIIIELNISHCDFCSIDTEGHDKMVLEGMDFNKLKPTVFCIESANDCHDILITNGYKYYKKADFNQDGFYIKNV